MQPIYGLLIIIVCLLVGVFGLANYIIPDVICKNVPPPTKIATQSGQYDSNLLSDICSGTH